MKNIKKIQYIGMATLLLTAFNACSKVTPIGLYQYSDNYIAKTKNEVKERNEKLIASMIENYRDGDIFIGPDGREYIVKEYHYIQRVYPKYQEVLNEDGVTTIEEVIKASDGWTLNPEEWTSEGIVYESTTKKIAEPFYDNSFANTIEKIVEKTIQELDCFKKSL